MEELDKQSIGDGQDNYGQAAAQTVRAIKQAGEASAQAAKAGAEAVANAAAATVQASVETGSATAKIAAGTAAGGPWGAVLSAALGDAAHPFQNPGLLMPCSDGTDHPVYIPSVHCV